jgi:hypothetical protein
MPKHESGYFRPLSDLVGTGQGFNYKLANGVGGVLSSLAEVVPGGTDIEPILAGTDDPAQANGIVNCTPIGYYQSPTFISFYVPEDERYYTTWAGGVYPSQGALINDRCLWQHNAVFRSTGGEDLQMFSGAVGVTASPWGRCFGPQVWFQFYMTSNQPNYRYYEIRYQTFRTGYLEIEGYEWGGDGITAVDFISGDPYAVTALRVSDGSRQVLPAGGIELKPGKGAVALRLSWASGSADLTGLAWKMRGRFEVPYGM